MNRDMKFIKTTDVETAKKLRMLGFTELTESNSSVYCFINNGNLTFDAEKNNCVYTNLLHV